MMFNLMILVGLIFALLGYKKAWYPSWAFLFNILISVYISIMAVPQIVDNIPDIRKYLGDFSYAAGMFTAAVVIFAVTHFLTVRFLISGYRASFPKLFNIAGAAVLGFFAGLILAGFLLFLVTILPLEDCPAAEYLTKIDQTSTEPGIVVRHSCNVIHSLSFHAYTVGVDRQISKIRDDWRGPEIKPEPADPNSDPNSIEVINKFVVEANESEFRRK
ncbi:MAG: hypothetical protein JW806_02835 [Sedimentisphaerales bacterium]|nr:hypothetical protein [Sedimentisphaerales bacterium]